MENEPVDVIAASFWNTNSFHFFDELPFAVAVLQGDEMLLTYTNKSMRTFCDGQHEEVVRQIILQSQPHEEVNARGALSSIFIRGKRLEHKELPVRLLLQGKQQTKYVDVSLNPLRNETGNITGLFMTIMDVTEKREARLQLSEQQGNIVRQNDHWKWQRESEEINRLFIEYAPAAMAMFDTQMNYIAVSKQWMKDYSLSGDIIGRNHYELFPHIPQRWKDLNARCLKGEVIVCKEDRIRTKKGKVLWLKWETHPWYNTAKEIGGMVIFAEDITDQKETENQVRESEERFRSMASEAPLFVWVTDEKLQTTFLNKAGLNYFDVDESLPIHELSWKKFIHSDDLPDVINVMNEAAMLREPYTLEMRLKNGITGEYRWFLDKGVPRYKDNHFSGFIGTSLDIQERKELEAVLDRRVKERTTEIREKNKELEEMIERLHRQELLDEQKNNFIAMASHELKTPITSIKGYVQLLLSALEQKEEKPLPGLLLRSSLLSVDKQIVRLTRLISELLDVSKIEAGALELKKEKFSFNELAIEMVEDILYTNPQQKINLYHDDHGYVYADKDRIGQVMTNFLTNAIKYSPSTDSIEVLIEKTGENEIAYSVKDHGIGIEKNEQDKIFNKFYRVQGKVERTFPGFGIGLYVARQFVERHGGRIMVTSEKEQGTTFTFTLQLASAD